jgi:hypothetical protein
MCGMEFCGPCRNEAVENWAHGLTHSVPKFGDLAQEFTAKSKRSKRVHELERSGDFAALVQFPEWRWARGESQVVPTLGHYHDEAIRKRSDVLNTLCRAGNIERLSAFPEWQSILRWLRIPHPRNMAEVLAQVPRTMAPPKKRAPWRKIQRYRKWLDRWEAPLGGAYRHLLRRLMRTVGHVSSRPQLHMAADQKVAA